MSATRLAAALIWLLVGFSSSTGARAGPPQHEVDYQKARAAYYRFKASKEKQKLRHHWQNTAKLFERMAAEHPKSDRVDDSLFTAGKLYYDLYVISRVREDLDKAVALFEQVVDRCPDSHLADDAQLYIALQWIEYRKDSARAAEALGLLVKRFPEGDITPKARRMLEDLGGPAADSGDKEQARPEGPEEKKPGGRPVLYRIGSDSGPDYSRITLFTRTRAAYKYGRLESSKTHPNPRLYVDLTGTGLEEELHSPVELRDSVVGRVRFAPRGDGSVRIVLDLVSECEHKVFFMDNPARVVVDVSAAGTDKDDGLAAVIKEKNGERTAGPEKDVGRKKRKTIEPRIIPKAASKPGRSLSMLAGLKIRRIAIDPGHGGRDPGAIGPNGTLEKHITLDIAKRLAGLLSEDRKLDLKDVILTRKTDRFLRLEKRTAIANAKKADLFISIHCNAHRDRRFKGVETFYLDLTNDRYSIKLAARENATSEKTISDLRFILADLALKSHVDDSISLGNSIQKATVGTLRRSYKGVKDLKLKPALFYVLIGARMPSVLIETSFISNPEEERRLARKSYRQKLAKGIYTGIKNFIQARREALDPDS